MPQPSAEPMMSTKRVALIGSVGIPNVYGGFEMFAEACAPEFAKNCPAVYVTCDRGRYADRARLWRGVRRIFIPCPANNLWSIAHDLLAFLAVFWRAEAVIVLGVSGGVFFPLFRLLSDLCRVRLIVNLDGLEWRRTKFSKAKRAFLFASDRIAQRFAHVVVADNEALRQYLLPAVAARARFIAYPGDHVLSRRKFPRLGSSLECLTICRIEPENHCDILLKAFARVEQGHYRFVGNWHASEYGEQLWLRYHGSPGIELMEATYDPDQLNSLREQCTVYLHGHTVGGTNPSLVEMLYYDCKIIAFDCAFNRATAGDASDYFEDLTELVDAIKTPDTPRAEARAQARMRYTLETICSDYLELIEGSDAPPKTGQP
jgi:glycosyltransferase involved in cell wall biosynthesis